MYRSKEKGGEGWCTLTQLGQFFGLNAIKTGQVLLDAGYRHFHTKNPSSDALLMGFAKAVPLASPHLAPFFLWHEQKTKALLESLGQTPLSSLDYLVVKHAHALLQVISQFKKIGAYGATHYPYWDKPIKELKIACESLEMSDKLKVMDGVILVLTQKKHTRYISALTQHFPVEVWREKQGLEITLPLSQTVTLKRHL